MMFARGYRKFALIWEEDAYGEDLAYQFNVSLNNMDAQLVYQWSYSRERADFRLPVNELKGTDADVIFFAGIEPWAGDFLREARAVGLSTGIVGAFSDTPEMRARAGRGLEGAMYFDIYNPLAPSQQTRRSCGHSGRAMEGLPTPGPRKVMTRCIFWLRRSGRPVPPIRST